MATAKDFYREPIHVRACLLYEFKRGLSPEQAQIEMMKACRYKIEIDVITGWFARFSLGNFDVDLASDHINADKPGSAFTDREKETYDQAYKKIENEKKFVIDKESENLLGFFTDIEKLKGEEGFKVIELEISVKNDTRSYPKHVVIVVECATRTTSRKFVAVEIFHCENGVVIRRDKNTNLLESPDRYKYYDIALKACKKLVDMLKNEQVDTLKLFLDLNDNSTELEEHHRNFFQKLMTELEFVGLSDPLTVTDLIKFHNKVKVSKALHIKHGKVKITIQDASLLQIKNWVEAFQGTFDREEDSNVMCVIHVTVDFLREVTDWVNTEFNDSDSKVEVGQEGIIITRRNRGSSDDTPCTSAAASEPMDQ